MGQIQYAFDMMCERVLSRETQGELLANKAAAAHAHIESRQAFSRVLLIP